MSETSGTLPTLGTWDEVTRALHAHDAAEARVRGELQRQGMDPSTAARVAGEAIANGSERQRNIGRLETAADEISFFGQVAEAGLGVLEHTGGFTGVPGIAAKIQGKPSPSRQVGAAIAKPENKVTEAVANANLPAWVSGFVSLLQAYGPRLAEIIAGAALILFGLVTLAKGGQRPSIPGVG